MNCNYRKAKEVVVDRDKYAYLFPSNSGELTLVETPALGEKLYYSDFKQVEFDLFKNGYFTTGEFQKYVVR
jgi:hypothetical protein